MAFCTKCGKELKDGDQFCYHCGAPVKGRNEGKAPQGRENGQSLSGAAGIDMKKIAIAAGAAVLVLIGVFAGVRMGSTKGPAAQEAGNRDLDTADYLKKTDSGNSAPQDASSEVQPDQRGGLSGQSSGDEDVKETEADAQELALEVIDSIESKPRYGIGVSFGPLAASDDFNGDGIQELLTVYELRDHENTVEVMYGLWSLQGDEAEPLEEGVLFTEVAGNSGTAGIVIREDTAYLATEWSEPVGESFHKYYSYVPMSKTESALENTWYYMEAHGSYTDETAEGRYILGDSNVDKNEFEAKIQEFSDRVYELNVMKGPEGDGVMTFEEMKANFQAAP